MKIEQHLAVIIENFSKLKSKSSCIEEIADAWIMSLAQGNKIMFCGNGGSAADSQHLAAELVGRYKINRSAIPAMSLTVDTSALTAIANDFGYEQVLCGKLKDLAKQEIVLWAFPLPEIHKILSMLF